MEPTETAESTSDELRDSQTFADEGPIVDDAEPVSSHRADRFYDRIRKNIASFMERKGSKLGKASEFLMFVPDIFILLFRLTTDKAVSTKNKVLLGTGIAYYIFPLDIMPEAFMGPVGYLDDLVFGVYILNKMIGEVDEELVRKHWSGKGDVIDVIKRVLASADGLVTSDFLTYVKKMMK